MVHRILLLLFLIPSFNFAQEYEYVYRNIADSSHNSYLIVFPIGEVRGLVVRDYTNLPDTTKSSPYKFTKLCSEQGLMTLYTNTSTFFPELFVKEEPMEMLLEMINEVVERFDIPKENLFIGGLSASGSRALRFAEYCQEQQTSLQIRGVFAVDSPLDLARFYQSAHENKDAFKAGMKEEAIMMQRVFKELFPNATPQDFAEASVFTHKDPKGGNAQWLHSTSIILFTEPDMDWWKEKRGATYFDINSYDFSAFFLKLSELKNKDITLITTTGKGLDRQGNPNPHSWSIVDEEVLLTWVLERLTP